MLDDLAAMAEKVQTLNEEKAAVKSLLEAAELRLGDVESVVARVDSDGDGFPDVDDSCPTAWGVPPDGCPVH